MADECPTTLQLCRPKRLATIRRFQSNQAHAKQEIRKKLRKVSKILKKKETERTEEEIHTLHQLPDVVKEAEKNAKRQLQQKQRILEIEDEPDVLDQKCEELAQMLLSAKNAIVYTGAGISTAASIPDYRGPNGVWTLLRKGQSLRSQDLVDAEPTFTHMCITRLFKMGRVKYLVSQNCDGLHIRSGFPRHSLSEVHGNMFIEICKNCKPQKEYLRLFDVTERTAKRRHETGRTCSKCGGVLCDTIVHFGEKGGLKSPYKWKQAIKAVSKSDLIICLGSSLKVLRRYPSLWRMEMRPEQRPKLVIVNLQWTPKDEQASLKIHGRCDDVLRRLTQHLAVSVPPYHRETDPLFRLHSPMQKGEEQIASKKSLKKESPKLGHPSINPRKVFHSVPNNVPAHRPSLLKTDSHLSGGNGLTPSCTAHNSSAFRKGGNYSDLIAKREESFSRTNSRCVPASQSVTHGFLDSVAKHENHSIPYAESSCEGRKFFPHLLADSKTKTFPHAAVSSENRHIPDPLRQKLEQMLKERGMMTSKADTTSDGTFHLMEGRTSVPLPSIQNLLLHSEGEETTPQLSHPNLLQLLSCDPLQSQLTSAVGDHDVFRVDLSTNPVSISTSQCSFDGAASDYLWITLDFADGSIAASGSNSDTAPSSSVSDYAKLLRHIHFDHSYSKPPHKARPSGKAQKTTKNFTCSVNAPLFQQGQDSHSFSAASVIPSSNHDHWTTNPSSSEQDVGYTIHSLYGDMHSDPAFLHHIQNPECSSTQDKVVVNLNADTAFALHTFAQLTPSALQAHQDLNVTGAAEQPASSSFSICDTKAVVTRDCEQSDEDSENHQTSGKRKKPASVPGWFGKGLRVRRKRTM